MAHEREIESAQPDPLFRDPWAAAMVAAGRESAGQPPSWLLGSGTLADLAPGMAGYVTVRTRWIDDRLRARLPAAGPAQLVLVAAGLDTRVARLPLPADLVTFLLDRPEVLEVAAGVLRGAYEGEVVFVPTDLAGDWVGDLTDRGFRPDRPTVWVVEGLLMYLDTDRAGALVAALRELSAPGSALIADVSDPHVHTNELFAPGRETLATNASPLRCSVADPQTWLAGLGWVGVAVDPVAVAAGYGREVPPALDPRPADGPSFRFLEGVSEPVSKPVTDAAVHGRGGDAQP